MSRDVVEVPSIPVESPAVSNFAEYALAPAAPRNDSSKVELPQVDMYDSEKDKAALTKELAPKLFPNAKPNSETAPDRPSDTETAPDRPRDSETAPDRPSDTETAPDRPSDGEAAPDRPSDSETAPDRPSDDSRRRILPLNETPIEGNSREMGSQLMKNLEKYRQWLKAHPPNIKLL